MDIAKLKAELTTDPLGLGYAALDHGPAAALINATPRTYRRPLQAAAVFGWLWSNSRWIAVVEAQADGTLTVGQRRVAKALVEMARWREFAFDSMAAPWVNGLAALVAAGVLSQAQADAVQVLAEVKGSRADELGLGRVHYSEVRQARKA